MNGYLDWQRAPTFFGDTSDCEGRTEIIFKDGDLPGHDARYDWKVTSPTNILTYDNFKTAFASASCSGNIAVDTPALFELNFLNYSQLTNCGSISFGYATSTNKTFRMNVSGGSYLRLTSINMKYPGRLELNVSGEGTQVSLGGLTQMSSLARASCSTASVAIVDHAVLTCNDSLYFGYDNADQAATSYATLLLSNVTATVRRNFKLSSGVFTLVDADLTQYAAESDTCFEGGGYDGVTAEFYADNVQFHWQQTKQLTMIQKFTTAKLGARGLTAFAEKSYNYTIPQSFTDWTTGGTLTLVPYTGKSMTLSGADSQESNLVIANSTVYLASGANHYSHLVVTNEATYSLVGGATGTTLRGFTLGNATSHGTLALDADDVVTVEGPINFVNSKITYSSTLATGVHTVFRMTVEPSDAIVERWESGGTTMITSGLPSSGYHLCTVVKEGDYWLFQIEINRTRPEQGAPTTWQGGDSWSAGAWSDGVPTETNAAVFGGTDAATVAIAEKRARTGGLTLENGKGVTISGGEVRISDSADAAINVTSGTNEIASNLRFVADTPIVVAADAELTVSGRAYGPGFTKSGDGHLKFENAANTFGTGFTLNGGWLTFVSPETMGFFCDLTGATLNAGTLEILDGGETQQGLAVTGPAVIKTEGDVSMILKSGTSGAIFKRGAGQATLDIPADLTLALTSSDSNTGYTTDDALAYPANGAIPSKYNAITIAEGELALRGNGAKRTVKMGNNYLTIGAPVLEHSGEVAREPGLVLDNVTLENAKINVGSGLASSATFAVEPYIVVSNGATLAGSPDYCRYSDLHGARIFADNGSVSSGTLNNNAGLTVTNRFCLVNGSSLNSSRCTVYGSADLVFTNSVWCNSTWNASDRSQCKAFYVYVYPSDMNAKACVNAIFAQGSVCACSSMTTSSSWDYHKAEFNFAFDGSEWWPGTDASLTIGSERLNLHIITQGDGLIIQPVSDQSFRLFTIVEGDGPLIKKGAGTLVVDCEYKGMKYTEDRIVCAYTGLTDVQEGTLAITNGALRQAEGILFRVAGTLDLDGASVTGAVITAAGGTIRNATLVNPTFKVEYDDNGAAKGITLDGVNGCAVSGKVVFDFAVGDGTPTLPIGTQLTVATYTGTKPDTTYWRSKNVGTQLYCRYVANDGTIVATVRPTPGMMVILR